MREILFRGKRTDNGEWVEGYYLTNPEWDRKTYGEYHWIISCENGIQYEINPETVGQYTGLKDKNGKEIFEGDVVVPTFERRLSNKPRVVEHDPLSAYWQCAPKREPLIIGNIHDNPELLEE